MNLYVSNLVAGLENGLDDVDLLMRSVAPFRGQAGIEFFLHTHSSRYMGLMENVPSWLEGLPAAAHGPFIGIDATSPQGSKEQKDLLQAYRYAFNMTKRLQSSHLVVHTHQRVIEPWEKEQAQRDCFNNLKLLSDMGEDAGVTLAIENLGIQRRGVSLFDQTDFQELFQRFPKADCLIDTGHLLVAGWNMAEVLCALSKKIRGYHLHDNDGRADSHLRIGKGRFDFPAFFSLYRRYTPEADITLEYSDCRGITAQDIQDDLAYVLRGISSMEDAVK